MNVLSGDIYAQYAKQLPSTAQDQEFGFDSWEHHLPQEHLILEDEEALQLFR